MKLMLILNNIYFRKISVNRCSIKYRYIDIYQNANNDKDVAEECYPNEISRFLNFDIPMCRYSLKK